MAAPRASLPRSPAGLLAGPNGLIQSSSNGDMSSSSSSLASGPSSTHNGKVDLSISPVPTSTGLRRHSTASSSQFNLHSQSHTPSESAGTPSGQAGLDYYWSSLAGHGSNSSLDISPSPSIHSVGLGLGQGKSKSHLSLADMARMQRGGSSSSSFEVPAGGARSRGSRYSQVESASSDSGPDMDLERQSSGTSSVAGRGYDGGGQGLEPGTARDSSLTYRPRRVDEPEEIVAAGEHRTPIPPTHFVRLDLSPRMTTPKVIQTTPKRAAHPKSASSASSNYTPTSGRPIFASPAQSIDEQREREPPRSAPAWQADFGMGDDEEDGEGEETLKGRRDKRMTLPALSGGALQGLMGREDPRSDGRDASPGRSPQVPARSTLRAQRGELEPPRSTTPLSLSPRSSHSPLPTIINTHHSPDPSPPPPPSAFHDPSRPTRSPDRMSPSLSISSAINDLTDMLAGAIDEIGLIDSRDTPPPTVVPPPKKQDKDIPSALSLAPAPEMEDPNRPITPNSLPTRGMSLGSGLYPSDSTGIGNGGMVVPPPPLGTRRSTGPELLRKTSSILSFKSTNQGQSPTTTVTMNISARPWPAAMLYGHIKGLKNAGDRAKGYAKGINELARSETGLREWCTASVQSDKPLTRASTKMSGQSSLGRSQLNLTQNLSPYDPSPHPRQVSSGSEFPMRADSYSAREISQRVIDPHDQPTSLPSNLPYPQLQQAVSGMKPSQSMQSVASFATNGGGEGRSKRGFFGMGKKTKKDNFSLGAPANQNQAAGTAKKDVRGLSISGPSVPLQREGSPQRMGSISAPMGPREPRMGSFTPPPRSGSGSGSAGLDGARSSMDGAWPGGAGNGRASLDTGMARILHANPPARASLDNGGVMRLAKSSAPARSSPMASQQEIDEDAVRSMGDILPHVERGVLRGYLRRYGDQMAAIGAYFEDEKRGSVMRA